MLFSMNIINLDVNSKLLTNINRLDIIQYKSDRIPDGIYIIFSIEKDMTLPVIICEVWAFTGGYDHRFHRFLENGLGINKSITTHPYTKFHAKILTIKKYRALRHDLTEREEFHFDVPPHKTSSIRDIECNLPYIVIIGDDENTHELILPKWTPLQKLPIERVQIGTLVEVWQVNTAKTVMKIVKL